MPLSPRETFHLHRVLRLKAGDTCRIFSRSGWGAEAVIEILTEKEGGQLRIRKTFPLAREEKSVYLKVAQALPQKRKMDDLVEKAEELGIQELWVLETQRSVVKMRGEGAERAKKRWERIVVEAAKQSGTPFLTQIEGPVSFEKVIEEKLEGGDRAFLFHPDPKGISFSKVVEELKSSKKEKTPTSAFLFLGPEGGFTPEEVRWAESRGVRKVFLGSSTLRVETAFLGVVSALRFLTS